MEVFLFLSGWSFASKLNYDGYKYVGSLVCQERKLWVVMSVTLLLILQCHAFSNLRRKTAFSKD
jgi:hypothetical protein